MLYILTSPLIRKGSGATKICLKITCATLLIIMKLSYIMGTLKAFENRNEWKIFKVNEYYIHYGSSQPEIVVGLLI